MRGLLVFLLFHCIMKCAYCFMFDTVSEKYNHKFTHVYASIIHLSPFASYATSLDTSMLDLSNEVPDSVQYKEDVYAHWSFYNMIPPPIEKSITYDELRQEIEERHITSIQEAVQGNHLIVTTNEGHRLSCPFPIDQLQMFLLDFQNEEGLPFTVIPKSAWKQDLHLFSEISLAFLLGIVILDCLDLLPWDTNMYGSLQQREQNKVIDWWKKKEKNKDDKNEKK
mgnify:CR=1 FL=1